MNTYDIVDELPVLLKYLRRKNAEGAFGEIPFETGTQWLSLDENGVFYTASDGPVRKINISVSELLAVIPRLKTKIHPDTGFPFWEMIINPMAHLGADIPCLKGIPLELAKKYGLEREIASKFLEERLASLEGTAKIWSPFIARQAREEVTEQLQSLQEALTHTALAQNALAPVSRAYSWWEGVELNNQQHDVVLTLRSLPSELIQIGVLLSDQDISPKDAHMAIKGMQEKWLEMSKEFEKTDKKSRAKFSLH